MNNKFFFGLLLVAGIILVLWYVFVKPSGVLNSSTKKSSEVLTPTPASRGSSGFSYTTFGSGTSSELEKGGVSERTVITYTDTGFAPNPTTVKRGAIVTFVNESSRGMWVASGVHPTHQLLPGFDQLATSGKGGVYEYTFNRTGTWSYHNHLRPSDVATVIVVQ